MEKRIIECVPNFSEGRDKNIIKQITDAIESVENVKLIDVDMGYATNRTVVTFVGEPEFVVEAAFRAAAKAKELIDMTKHKGAHPRFGATDVCPLVPVANITMEETVDYARKLAQRIGEELEYPVYCYEFAAFKPERKNLANVRAGEYEGLPEKLKKEEWKPDFGPAIFVPKTGATAVGARKFLVAYNINLNTTSTRRANAIAFDVREKGRPLREGNPITGPIKKDEHGKEIWIPGTLKAVKGIGWFIDEYGIAQVSLNLTDLDVTPLHIAFEEVCKKAEARGVRVTGSEIVGVVPLKAMLDAGKYFLKKQHRSLGIPDEEIVRIAIKSLGLNELYPFDPKKKIIEYILQEEEEKKTRKKLINMSLKAFVEETASESPAPGGGSVSAAIGAMGAALGTMVANLSSHKPGWDDKWELYSDWAEKGKAYYSELLKLVDEDTIAFNKVMDAFGLPNNTPEEKEIRNKAIQEATKYAMEIPFKVMNVAYNSMEVMLEMAKIGNPNSVSDAGVGAIAAKACIYGAFLNVKINAASYNDKEYVNLLIKEATQILELAIKKEDEILKIVNEKIGI
ncbi:MAG: glutamate formimidoyltransferase [Bacteroidales bacterium]|nr:glutamate formimidoyltransferase [Bacteroidales bacterium]